MGHTPLPSAQQSSSPAIMKVQAVVSLCLVLWLSSGWGKVSIQREPASAGAKADDQTEDLETSPSYHHYYGGYGDHYGHHGHHYGYSHHGGYHHGGYHHGGYHHGGYHHGDYHH